MEEALKKFETIFRSDVVSYQLRLGSYLIPDPCIPVDGLKLAIFFLSQIENPFFKLVLLKKSKKFIYLNKVSGKFESIDFSENTDCKPVVLGEVVYPEELSKSFFITEV